MGPLFLEPVRAPELEDEWTGFEFDPDPIEASQLRWSPFRQDWERARNLGPA